MPGRAVLLRSRLALLLACALVVTMLPLSPAASAAPSTVPSPTVTGPIPVTSRHACVPPRPAGCPASYPWFATDRNLHDAGYAEREYFFEGTARSFEDGSETGTSAYKTRMVVRAPRSPKDFNGTVVVEWVNVTGQVDIEIDWFHSNEYFLREGIAWVGISAQRVGVEALKRFDYNRYSTLSVSDTYSHDIFSQAVKALVEPSGVAPLRGLRPRTVVATGHSQSAGQLGSYYNEVQSLHQLVDGFILHGGGGSPNEDVGIPVIKVGVEGEESPSVADHGWLVHWEVAGGSHVGWKESQQYDPLLVRDRGYTTPKACTKTPHSMVPFHYVLNASYAQLLEWIKKGEAPPTFERVDRDDDGDIMRDADGNATGGIQLPHHAVPTGVNDNDNLGAVFCILYGSHTAFDQAKLLALYPTRADFVRKMDVATARSVSEGVLLSEDARQVRAWTRAQDFGWAGAHP